MRKANSQERATLHRKEPHEAAKTLGVYGAPDGNMEAQTEYLRDAAIEFAKSRKLPNLWLVGWSFGTELALKYGSDKDIVGAILLSPPLHRATELDLDRWVGNQRALIALVPEFDDYLQPAEATDRFSKITHAEIIGVDGAKHLWVGESATKRVLDEIVRQVNPAAYPLPDTWTPRTS